MPYSMDSQLAEYEIKHNVTRWKQSDPDYVQAKADDFVVSRTIVYESLRVTVVKRHFLLKLKAKYAGMT